MHHQKLLFADGFRITIWRFYAFMRLNRTALILKFKDFFHVTHVSFHMMMNKLIELID